QLPQDRRLRRPRPPRRQAGRPSGAAADEVHPRGQSQDRQSDRSQRPGGADHARRPGDRMNRRTFITLLRGIATPWPWALPTRAQPARAQGGAMPVIGFMHSAARQPMERNIAAFRQALRAAGYVEGENVAFEFRFAENRYERLPELAADLVRRNVAV